MWYRSWLLVRQKSGTKNNSPAYIYIYIWGGRKPTDVKKKYIYIYIYLFIYVYVYFYGTLDLAVTTTCQCSRKLYPVHFHWPLPTACHFPCTRVSADGAQNAGRVGEWTASFMVTCHSNLIVSVVCLNLCETDAGIWSTFVQSSRSLTASLKQMPHNDRNIRSRWVVVCNMSQAVHACLSHVNCALSQDETAKQRKWLCKLIAQDPQICMLLVASQCGVKRESNHTTSLASCRCETGTCKAPSSASWLVARARYLHNWCAILVCECCFSSWPGVLPLTFFVVGLTFSQVVNSTCLWAVLCSLVFPCHCFVFDPCRSSSSSGVAAS